MIEPKRAPVRPRGLSPGGAAPLLLEEEILSLVRAGECGDVALLGPAGSGKTTALAHLAAVLPSGQEVILLDEPEPARLAEAPGRLVVYAVRAPYRPDEAHLAVYRLAPWGRDDLIEYLLAMHRPRCAAVLARVRPRDHALLGGLPELWRVVLDRLASDDSVPDVRRALHRHLEGYLRDTDLLERARSACLNAVVATSQDDALEGLARPGFEAGLLRLLCHPGMRLLLASERVASDLHGGADCDYLARRLPYALVKAAGGLVAADERAVEHLHALLAGPPWSHAMAASLLHAAGDGDGLRVRCPTQLAGAYLNGVSWPEVKLAGANLTGAELNGADLSRADLTGAVLANARLCRTRFHQARSYRAAVARADLRDAERAKTAEEGADFTGADLETADFQAAILLHADFTGCNLTRTVFRGAVLAHADFSSAVLQDTDFSDANLMGAVLSGLRFAPARWEGAAFARAKLVGCDLEYLSLPAADFEKADSRGALLTGSTMFGANFQGACLCDTGLADVEWEGADLRGADLRGASFHMGSTRSGLVGSTTPCEGSRTGFYTDDFDEQTYKAPEEIRKANLCGADLRGAILDDVDFYLVDLRGAAFDAKYEKHLRRCGAILEARV